MTVDVCRDPPKGGKGHLECWDKHGCTDICRAPVSQTTREPAWYKPHDLAVMRQALAKLDEAAALIEAAECGLGDMPPIRSPVYGQHLDQTVGEVLAKVLIVSEALKVAINAR